MIEKSTACFSLSNVLNWNIVSDNTSWIKQNVEEFRSSYIQQQSTNTLDIEILEVQQIEINIEAINISAEINCLTDTLYLKDKYSNKKLSILIEDDHYKISVEHGFTFYYYAAILDAFIKIMAFQKGIVALHASAILKGNKIDVFGAERQVGKTSIILHLLSSDDQIEVLADDAVFLTKEGKLIPYLRGIDLYPYLPISNKYLSKKDRIQRALAKGLRSISILPDKINTKILKRYFLPRLNLAQFNHGMKDQGDSIRFFIVKRNSTNQTTINNISASDLKTFLGKSSFFEFIEYLEPFEKVCSVFPKSDFSKLLFNFDEFQQKVNQAIGDDGSMTEINLSNNYSDLNNLSQII